MLNKIVEDKIRLSNWLILYIYNNKFIYENFWTKIFYKKFKNSDELIYRPENDII